MLQKPLQIVALVPEYGPLGGNQVRAYFKDGQQRSVARRLVTVLNRLAASYGCDVGALRRAHRLPGGYSQAVPLPLSRGLLLFPLKTRRPRAPSDGAHAFLNLHAFLSLEALDPAEDGTARCRLYLKGDVTLECLHSCETVNKRLLEAGQVAQRFHERTTPPGEKPHRVEGYFQALLQPNIESPFS